LANPGARARTFAGGWLDMGSRSGWMAGGYS